MLSSQRSLHRHSRRHYRICLVHLIRLCTWRIIHSNESSDLHSADNRSTRRRLNSRECAVSICIHTNLIRGSGSLFVVLDELPDRINVLLLVSGGCHQGHDCRPGCNVTWGGGCQQHMQSAKRNGMLQSRVADLRSISSSNRCNDDGDDDKPVYSDYGSWSRRMASYKLSGNDVCSRRWSCCWSGRRTVVNDLQKQKIP